MRGPGYRNDLDVRRTWTCPACGVVRKAMGQVTTLRCVACPAEALMVITSERIVPPRPVTEFDPHAERVPKPDPLDEPLEARQPKLMKGSKTMAKRALGDFGDGPQAEIVEGETPAAEALIADDFPNVGKPDLPPIGRDQQTDTIEAPTGVFNNAAVTPGPKTKPEPKAEKQQKLPPTDEDDFGAGVDLK